VSVRALRPAVPNGFGIRIKTIVPVGGLDVPVYIDVLFVGHDDVEAGIVVSSGPRPLARSREDALLEIVESRLVTEQNKDSIV